MPDDHLITSSLKSKKTFHSAAFEHIMMMMMKMLDQFGSTAFSVEIDQKLGPAESEEKHKQFK